jgi:hypothetical protein
VGAFFLAAFATAAWRLGGRPTGAPVVQPVPVLAE